MNKLMMQTLVAVMAVVMGGTGWGQSSIKRSPDCQINFSFTANGSSANLANYGAGGPSGPALCTFWTIGYSSTGFAAISLVFQSAPALTTTTPSTFVTYAGTVVTGVNPNTNTVGAQVTFSNGTVAVPWVRMTLASSTGTGTVFGILQGWTSGNDKSMGGGGGGGGGCTAVGLAGVIQASNGTGGCQATAVKDNGTTVASTEPVTAPSVATGSGPPSVTPGTGGVEGYGEGTAPSVCPTGAVDCVYADSTQHGLLSNFNNAGYLPLVQGPATSTVNHVALFNSTTGGLIKDGGALPSGPTTNQNVRGIGAGFDGGGTALTSGKTTYFTIPFACTIGGYNITADTGTVSFDVWKIGTGTAIPTVTNSILTGGFLALATGTALHSTSTSLFTTTTVTAFDIFGINLEASSGATEVSLVLLCTAN